MKLPARIEYDNPLTLVDKDGLYIGKLPLLRTRISRGTTHIREAEERSGCIRAVCGTANWFDPDEILSFVGRYDDTKPPAICVKCRRLIESGEKRYHRQGE